MRSFVVSVLLSWALSSACAQVTPDSTGWEGHTLYTSLEEALERPDSVYRLSLKGTKLDSLPLNALLRLPNLKVLDISRNKLTTLPTEIKELTGLEVLVAEKNKFTHFPSGLYSMDGLRVLNLGRNKMESISPLVSQMTSLEYLDVWGNLLMGLPDTFTSLPELRYLDMRGMQFSPRFVDKIKEAFPKATLHFDPPCDCVD